MQINRVDINSLVLDPSNARTHDDTNLGAIKGSLLKFGQQKPIVIDTKGIVLAGNGTLSAAKALGWDSIDTVTTELSGTEAIAYALADNRSSELAAWDVDILNAQLKGLSADDFDISDIGFDPDDFDLGDTFSGGETDEDAVPDVDGNTFGVARGDIWELGNHRVMCGDSTSKQDVDDLMNGEKADMVFTDPPYNIGYQDNKKSFDKIKNDKMPDADFVEFLKRSINWDTDTHYICCSWRYAHLFMEAMKAMDHPAKAYIVWNKVNPAQNLDKYYKAHEIILYSGKFGGQKTLRSDVWECKRERNTVHPTMKPIGLIEMAFEDNPAAKLVMDTFLGSGSTLIACEKTGRKCYGMEIDPHYCSVIIKRWQDFTGKVANKIG